MLHFASSYVRFTLIFKHYLYYLYTPFSFTGSHVRNCQTIYDEEFKKQDVITNSHTIRAKMVDGSMRICAGFLEDEVKTMTTTSAC